MTRAVRTPEAELTTREQSALSKHEAVIDSGIKSFMAVGKALLAIRSGKLYRGQFGTFEEYCRDRWGFSSSRARQLMGSVEVAEQVESVTNVTLSTESQARALAQVAPEQRAEVWEEAVGTATNGHVTAAHIAETAARVTEAEEWDGEPTEADEAPQSVAQKEPNTIGDLKDSIADFLDGVITSQPAHVRTVIADYLVELADAIRA